MGVLMLVSAIALGLALTASVEPAITSAHEAGLAARYAADTGVTIAQHELGASVDWNAVLAGQTRSAILHTEPSAGLALPDGTRADLVAMTHLANCGHASACSAAEMIAMTADRPWGSNNPRWQLFGYGRIDELLAANGASGVAAPPAAVVVWVGDDPAEQDGNPLADTALAPDGSGRPGAGRLVIRAEGFGVRAAHSLVLVTVSRQRGSASGAIVAAWREVR
jgi:hypothetical protein